MKYTAKDIIEQRICFSKLTEKQFNKLKEHFQALYPDKDYTSHQYYKNDKSWRFYPCNKNKHDVLYSVSSYSYTDSNFDTILASKEITFEEFDFEELYTLSDLANGKVAVINDGTLEELRTILKVAFPNDSIIPSGYYACYMRSEINPKQWNCLTNTKLPTQSVKDFIKQLEPENSKPMATQKLTRTQFIELYHKFNCSQWREEIDKYINDLKFSPDTAEMTIALSSIGLLLTSGTREQIKAVEDMGIKVKKDCHQIDTPFLVSDNNETFHIRYYAGYGKFFINGYKSNNTDCSTSFRYVKELPKDFDIDKLKDVNF